MAICRGEQYRGDTVAQLAMEDRALEAQGRLGSMLLGGESQRTKLFEAREW